MALAPVVDEVAGEQTAAQGIGGVHKRRLQGRRGASTADVVPHPPGPDRPARYDIGREERVGFVVPVYFQGLPSILHFFLKKFAE